LKCRANNSAIQEEKQAQAHTAIGGSGPALFFALGVESPAEFRFIILNERRQRSHKGNFCD
jgi:hypothetical protein